MDITEIKKQILELAIKNGRTVLDLNDKDDIQGVILDFVSSELKAVNTDEYFRESVANVYGDETMVGWLTVNTCEVIEKMDPIGWRCHREDYISSELEAGYLLDFGDERYYREEDVMELLKKD